ncbi:MAG: NAD(P)/FAD-dependent oxidoreductase [Phycisphaerae bacterium]
MRNRKSELLGDVDVIIVGGGPAGSSTALHLERLSPDLATRTLLLEKSRHPREKTCGGALTLNAERILSELAVPLEMRWAPVHHVRLVYGEVCIDLPDDGCAKRVVRRCDLDDVLFQTAKDRNVPTMEDVRVNKVVRRPSHLLVMTDHGHFRAKVVVSADGVRAVLRKTSGFGPGKLSRIYVAETPADPAKEPVFTEQVLLVDFSYLREGLKGYYWDFPCYIDGRPFVSRGIVAVARLGSHAYLDELLARRGVKAEGAVRKAWPIRHFDPRERFARPRMLLVGDALGSDPLFSEGISQGLACGRLAAEAIVDAFKRNDLSFSGYTKRVLRSRLGKELLAYSRAARFLYGRRAEVVLSLLHESQELRDLIGHSYAGTANIYDSVPRVAKLVAKHLIHYKQRMHSFRAAAAVTDRAGGKEEANAALTGTSVTGSVS